MTTEKTASVLVVDDDDNQRWMVQKYLQKHGFVVQTAKDGSSMREQMNAQSFDVVLLDVTMPGEDGFSLARFVKEHHQDVGIIMLTAAAELFDRVLGLEIGADDYITKPFEPRELKARVKSVLRRTASNSSLVVLESVVLESGTSNNNFVVFGEFRLNADARELRDKDNNLVALTSMEFDLLKAFAENPGKVLSRDKLLSIAHNREWDPYDRSIDIRIARVRRKIEPDPAKPSIIKTVRGAGYIFVSKRD